MAAILNSAILNLVILDSAIFQEKILTNSFSLNLMMAAILNSVILDSALLHKKTSLIHSDSTWWWQPSWILPCWIQTPSSWIQTPCYLLSDSLKNTLTPIWLWLKLIQSDSNSFILIELDDGSHLAFWNLEFGHLGFSHLIFLSQTHSHLPRLVPTICTKKLHSIILTQLDDGSHLEFCHIEFRHCHLGFRHLVIFPQINSKTLSLHSDSDSN